MMEKDPKDRIQTADEVASRLEPWFEALTTVPSYQMGKSPWQPSPMPLEKEPLHDTAPEGSGEWHENRYASGSESVSGTGQETARNEDGSTGPAPPLLPHTSSETKWQQWSIGALVLIITLLLGIVIGYLLA